MSEFFAMSGYGQYVWPAFGIGFGIVVLIYITAVGSLAAAKQEARRRLEMNPPGETG
jgi:heme exporter protein CcmD